MKRTVTLTILAAIWLVVTAVATAQDKVTLQYKAQKGQKMTYRLEADLSSEFGGQKIQLLIKQTSVDEILDVAASGEITRQSVDEEVEVTVNGQKNAIPGGGYQAAHYHRHQARRHAGLRPMGRGTRTHRGGA